MYDQDLDSSQTTTGTSPDEEYDDSRELYVDQIVRTVIGSMLLTVSPEDEFDTKEPALQTLTKLDLLFSILSLSTTVALLYSLITLSFSLVDLDYNSHEITKFFDTFHDLKNASIVKIGTENLSEHDIALLGNLLETYNANSRFLQEQLMRIDEGRNYINSMNIPLEYIGESILLYTKGLSPIEWEYISKSIDNYIRQVPEMYNLMDFKAEGTKNARDISIITTFIFGLLVASSRSAIRNIEKRIENLGARNLTKKDTDEYLDEPEKKRKNDDPKRKRELTPLLSKEESAILAANDGDLPPGILEKLEKKFRQEQ